MTKKLAFITKKLAFIMKKGAFITNVWMEQVVNKMEPIIVRSGGEILRIEWRKH